MHYSDGANWRPIFEGNAPLLQVATGCSHGRCHFCDMYHMPFTPSPLHEIKEDILELADRLPDTQAENRLFLTGGNVLCLPTEHLLQVLKLIAEVLPTIKSVGCFARITDIEEKDDTELRALANARLQTISIGAECGLDEALLSMDKGFDSRQIIEQCARLDNAGMSYALFYLLGIAGKGRGLENARATASVFGKTNPQIIMVHTMTAFQGTVLQDRIARGDFIAASEKENQFELKEFCSLFSKRAIINAAHLSNTIAFIGDLPQERQEILEFIESHIALDNEEQLLEMRRELPSI